MTSAEFDRVVDQLKTGLAQQKASRPRSPHLFDFAEKVVFNPSQVEAARQALQLKGIVTLPSPTVAA